MRPKAIKSYAELDLKLGIKSSLPHIKSTLALSLLIWEGLGRPAEMCYAEQSDNKLFITDDALNGLMSLIAEAGINDVSLETIREIANDNQLFKSQLESLIVAYELVWKLAQVRFVDFSGTTNERTGYSRYPKRMSFTTNADIFHCVIQGKRDAYLKVLFNWIGLPIQADSECERNLIGLFTAYSESAVFKLNDGAHDILFNQIGIYNELLNGSSSVNIEDHKEAKGPLRILKSILSDGLQAYLTGTATAVKIIEGSAGFLSEYEKRAEMLLQLSATKIVGTENLDDETQDTPSGDNLVVSNGENVLLYGVPGAGKELDDPDRIL